MLCFILINYTNNPKLRLYHNKAITLDHNHCHTPFPTLFIIHEIIVHGCNPFAPTQPETPSNIHWQDWIENDSIFDESTGSLKQNLLPVNDNGSVWSQSPGPLTMTKNIWHFIWWMQTTREVE